MKRKKQPVMKKYYEDNRLLDQIEDLQNKLDAQDCDLRNATEVIGQLTVLCMKHGITIEIK